jgi:hypothetical protein
MPEQRDMDQSICRYHPSVNTGARVQVSAGEIAGKPLD